MAFSSVLTFSYFTYFFREIFPESSLSLLQKVGKMMPNLNLPKATESLSGLAIRFTLQSFVKFMLTEGEKYIMVCF